MQPRLFSFKKMIKPDEDEAPKVSARMRLAGTGVKSSPLESSSPDGSSNISNHICNKILQKTNSHTIYA